MIVDPISRVLTLEEFFMVRWMTTILCTISLCVSAETRQSIVWLYSEMPPAYISQGKHEGKGYADLTMQLIIDALPQYEHIKVRANYKRSIIEMTTHENRCHAALLKNNQREKDVIYSEPTFIISTNELFVKRSNQLAVKQYLTDANTVDLARLLENEPFVLGVSNGAIYGDSIDSILSLPTSRDNLVFRSAIDHYSGLSDMLRKKKRLDGFLGLSIENTFFNELPALMKNEITGYKIAGDTRYLVGYIGCSRSPSGEAIIKEVDKVILSERKASIKKYYQHWLLPKDKAAHQAIIEKEF